MTGAAEEHPGASATGGPRRDPRLAAPFTIDCPVAGRSRWADGRNWVKLADRRHGIIIPVCAGLAVSADIHRGYAIASLDQFGTTHYTAN